MLYKSQILHNIPLRSDQCCKLPLVLALISSCHTCKPLHDTTVYCIWDEKDRKNARRNLEPPERRGSQGITKHLYAKRLKLVVVSGRSSHTSGGMLRSLHFSKRFFGKSRSIDECVWNICSTCAIARNSRGLSQVRRTGTGCQPQETGVKPGINRAVRLLAYFFYS